MPMAFPVGPTLAAASRTSRPPPQPRSTTVSPSRRLANAVGLPQDRPRFASAKRQLLRRIADAAATAHAGLIAGQAAFAAAAYFANLLYDRLGHRDSQYTEASGPFDTPICPRAANSYDNHIEKKESPMQRQVLLCRLGKVGWRVLSIFATDCSVVIDTGAADDLAWRAFV